MGGKERYLQLIMLFFVDVASAWWGDSTDKSVTTKSLKACTFVMPHRVRNRATSLTRHPGEAIVEHLRCRS